LFLHLLFPTLPSYRALFKNPIVIHRARRDVPTLSCPAEKFPEQCCACVTCRFGSARPPPNAQRIDGWIGRLAAPSCKFHTLHSTAHTTHIMATSNFAYTTYSNRSRRTRSSSPPRSRVSTGSLGHHDDVGMSTSSAPLARRPGGNSTTPPVSTSSMHAHAGLYMSCPPPRMLCRGLEQDAMEARVRSLPTHHKCLTLSLPTFIPVIAIQDSSSSSFRTMAPVGNKPNHKGKAVLAGGLSGAFEICWYV